MPKPPKLQNLRSTKMDPARQLLLERFQYCARQAFAASAAHAAHAEAIESSGFRYSALAGRIAALPPGADGADLLPFAEELCAITREQTRHVEALNKLVLRLYQDQGPTADNASTL